jgi:hydroxymethylbilane synthase
MNALRIGTRGSALALWQARTVASLLAARGVASDIVIYKTSGDRLQEAPLTEAGTKGLFVKELEDALLGGAIDLAVHSAKDMSVTLPDGLVVAAVLPREDPRDAIVLPRLGQDSGPHAGTPASSEQDAGLAAVRATLGETPAFGTSSIRRSAQLAALWPKARYHAVRGNVDTRLRKLDAGEFDAMVLAAAGLKRLGYDERISLALPPAHCIPAPCQGIVAIETRADSPLGVAELNDATAWVSFRAERALVAALGGGCQLPLGAIATPRGATLGMDAIVVSPDGARRVRHAAEGTAGAPEELGRRLAGELAARGAVAILDEVR